MLYLLGAGLGAVGILLAAIAIVVKPGPGNCNRLTCYQPPTGPPLQAGHQYASSQFGFGLTWFDQPGETISPKSDADRLTLDFGSDGIMQFRGVAANGQTPQQVVESWVAGHLPDAQLAYVVPDASIGYRMGYGGAYNVAPQGGSGSGSGTRAIVFAAIKDNVAVLSVVLGDYQKYSFENGGLNDGHPSPADSFIAMLADTDVNTVLWKGDPQR